MLRISTAEGGESAFHTYLYDSLPPGLTLNIGAGRSRAPRGRAVIGVDHAARADARPWVVADATALPFKDGSVHAVLMKDVIEHLADPIGALAEARRVLAPTGAVAIVTPRAVPRAVWNDPTHIRGFTARALRTALRLAGLEPMRGPRRVGRLPGAGRYYPLTRVMLLVTLVPGLGHYLGVNWLVVATPTAAPTSTPAL